ncbi:MAG: ABC transporter ATP-binding protein [Coriobacteriales bacterium]|jgi:ABC-2 type transport system ATP-binding protein|nr:ABC transporter ATP-binding protein [Coriobacteriales bacterium]
MLEIKSIVKSYGTKAVLNKVTFSVVDGAITAVIGPNGSGKTTLFDVLVGIQDATTNDSTLNGNKLSDIAPKDIGFLPETPFLFTSFTTRDALSYDMTMRDIPETESRWQEIAARFRIGDALSIKVGELSQGMKKRVALTCAFLGTPSVIILDEPLNALDIQTVIALKEQLYVEKKRGAHILISSHVLSFLDGLANEFIFLSNGKVACQCEGSDKQAEDIYQKLFCV